MMPTEISAQKNTAALPQQVGSTLAGGRRTLIRDVAFLSITRYLVFAAGFVVSIFQKRLLGPYLVGVWQLLSIARQYLSYGDLGVFRGAEQQLPALYASQDARLVRTRDVSYTATLLLMALVNSIVVAVTFTPFWVMSPMVAWGVRIMAAIAIIESMANLMEVSALRSQHRFQLVSMQILGSELLFLALSLPAITLWGVYGLLAATLASLLFKLIFMRATAPERVRFQWDPGITAALWRMGFPLTLFVILFKTFDTVDRFLLLKGNQLEQLGFYSIATMATIFLGHLPLAISQVFFPRTMTWVAQEEPEALGRYLRQSQLGIIVVMGAAIGLCYFLMPPLVAYALPGFAPGIDALKVSVWSGFFVGLVHLPIQYQTAFQRQWSLVILAAAVSLLYYGFGLFLAFHWVSTPQQWLVAVAAGRVISYGLLWVALTVWIQKSLKNTPSLKGHGLEAVALCAYLIALMVAVDRFIPGVTRPFGAMALTALARLCVFGLGFWPVLMWVDRSTHLLESLSHLWQTTVVARLQRASSEADS